MVPVQSKSGGEVSSWKAAAALNVIASAKIGFIFPKLGVVEGGYHRIKVLNFKRSEKSLPYIFLSV